STSTTTTSRRPWSSAWRPSGSRSTPARPRNRKNRMTRKAPATSPTRSSAARRGRPGFVVVGNPGCRRVALFQAALARLRLPAAAVVPYADLLAGRVTLEQVVGPGMVVRLESPGRDFGVEKALLAAGADEPDADGPTRIGRAAAGRLAFDKGRIWYPRQW